MPHFRIKTLSGLVICVITLFFFSSAFAETPSQKAAKQSAQKAKVAPLPVFPPKIALFKVNPPIRLKNSNLQVLAGKKLPNTPIFVNNKLVIPKNKHSTWYYELPLTGLKPNKVVISSGLITLKNPPYFQVLNLDTATTLNVDPPKITKIRVDPSTRDIILTIQDPPGVLSYNVYFADKLGSSVSTTPFTLAQADYPTSGTGTTEWRDNGSFTKLPPLDPQVKTRFYRLEVGRVDLTNFQLTGITPQDGSTILAGAKIDIQASVFNPQNEILWYQFSLGGTVVQSWSTLNTYTWETTVSDTGTVNITCEAKNNADRQVSKSIAYQIINPSQTEVFARVKSNYALISDKVLDSTASAALNGEPLGSTRYYREYFKAPDKHKTEKFTDAARTAKTNIEIINGSNMFLINPQTAGREDIDLLSERGITAAQYNQLDLYYNQELFFENHTITRNDEKSEPDYNIIAFDVVPNGPHPSYDKLGLYIECVRGLVFNVAVFKKNSSGDLEFSHETRITDIARMPNGAWVPTGVVTSSENSDNELSTSYTYSNVRVNIGLNDTDFDPSRQ